MSPHRPTLARFAVLAVLSLALAAPGAGAAETPPGREVAGERLAIPRGVVVNFAELARREALRPRSDGLQARPRVFHRGLQEPPSPRPRSPRRPSRRSRRSRRWRRRRSRARATPASTTSRWWTRSTS